MELISIEDYRTRFPVIDDKIDIEKMPENIRGYHFVMYSLYTDFLVNFIINNTSILNCEKLLNKSGLDFYAVRHENKDFYQATTGKYLEYFYIRNNIHLENLSKEETKFLSDRILNDEFNYDEEVQNFILSTFKRVISEVDILKSPAIINYGPEADKFYAPSNALIIGFRYDDSYDENNNVNKIIFANDVIDNLQKEISEKLNVEVSIITYDDSSIKKKNNTGIAMQ